jgi:toxin ParE1/3/4
MSRFRLSPEAAQDIAELLAYIARDSVQAARRVRQALLAACRRLAEHPGIGHRREDLTDKPVRFFPVYSFLMIYDPASRPLEIVRVLRGAQDIATILEE